ncbi:basic amino acid ABC transporter substrate-binding protein [Helicobacter aurati]|uniref:Basic amino acid ABC transporter substrate-binding protein n=1 Tax=Helicobacter aurati TaxID=137778 RepID=A0A3D8J1A1_9HELI|nr:transporter substrate-binding domain-containing protein [Helicobacter aurati]RDU71000.1 basic amino acid ABC transporter substrate-binding protein [Helicobacter aurati]
MAKILQFFCYMLIFLFISCDSQSQKQSTTVLRIGLNAEYPPFEFKQDDTIVGFDIDLLESISKKVGFQYTLHHMSFDGLIPALKAGKIDMIMSGMSATPERAKQIDFTIPYYEGQTLYLKHKDNAGLTDKESIKGKRVGVFIGTVQEQAINKIKEEYHLTVVPSDSIFGAIMNLKNNKVDVVAADHATAKGYIRENKELEGFYQEADGSAGLSIAFDKGKYSELLEKINIAIEELKQEDEYNRILQKYQLQ